MQARGEDAGIRAHVVTVLGYNIALSRRDGGGQRVQAFLRSLEAGQLNVNFLGVGPRETDEAQAISSSLMHRVKRRLLPVPLRTKFELEANKFDVTSPTISLVPLLNRIAIRGGRPCWLDFPDLSSDIARNHAATVDPMSAICNQAQAWLWSMREAEEYEHADVVTVASPTDLPALGRKAVWLPTPVAEAVPQSRRSAARPDAGVVCGLIANFDYPPNRHAYDHLIQEWLPALVPITSKIVVAGFGSERLPRANHVEIIGPVEAIADFYGRIDVALAPINRGGGMKVKVVEAMMHGVPVVTTEHTRNGLPEALGAECIDIHQLLTAPEVNLRQRLRDPRESPAAAIALDSFTFASFQRIVDRLWKGNMVA